MIAEQLPEPQLVLRVNYQSEAGKPIGVDQLQLGIKTVAIRNRAFTLAIISGMSALAFSGADASAATELALADEELVAVTYGITQIVQNKNNEVIIWNRALHGERCVYRIGGCRYFHKGYYYQSPWWTAPLIFGDGPDTNFYHDGDYRGNIWSGKHIAWCFNRYRPYNPRNNTWISNSGKVLQCRSPSPY